MVELGLRAGRLSPEWLQHSTDQSLLDQLGRLDLGDARANDRLQRFCARFARRELPKRVLVLPAYLNRDLQQELLDTYFAPGAPEARFAWEEDMERRVRAALGRDVDVLMYCPARRMQLRRRGPWCACRGAATAPCRWPTWPTRCRD